MDGEESKLEWWETFDGILWKLESLRDENIALNNKINELQLIIKNNLNNDNKEN